jgi:DNA (cytosine-5)-methyltransferase 1
VGVPQLRHRLFVLAVRRDLGVGLPPPFTPLVAPPTVADALGDLPALEAGEQASEYARPAETPLQRALRGNEAVLTWHEAPAHAPAMLRLIKALPLEGGTRSDLASAVAPASGFHNTYGRLRSDRPAPAVTSSIGRVSSGRHVHPTQHRALTPREAARLQTFPDSYRWKGNRWAVYAQIGNAVPPMLAAAIAGPLLERLGSSYAAPRRAA